MIAVAPAHDGQNGGGREAEERGEDDVRERRDDEIHAQVEEHEALLGEPLADQRDAVASRHLDAAALPALPLRARLLGGGHHVAAHVRLRHVRDAVPGAPQADAVLHVLHDREGVVRDLGEDAPGEAHAVSAEAARHAEALARARPQLVEERQRDDHEACTPGRVRVPDPVLGLHGLHARLEARGERAEQVGGDAGVGVDDEDRVGEALRQAPLEGEVERVALPALRGVVPHQDHGAGLPRALGGGVDAVVGDDDDPAQVGGIVDEEQALHRLADARLLVVGGDDDLEAHARLARRRRRLPARQEDQHEEVRGARQHGERGEGEQHGGEADQAGDTEDHGVC